MKHTLLLLSGFDGTGLLFEPLLRILPKRYAPVVVAYPPHTPLSYEESASFAAQHIPHDAASCIVLGESYSGPVALQLAAQYPSLVAAVVLCNSFVTSPVPLWLLRLLGIFPLSSVASLAPVTLLRWLLVEPSTSPELLATLQRCIRTPHKAVMRQRFRNIASVHALGYVAHSAVPILALTGTNDVLVSPDSWAALAMQYAHVHTVALAAPHLLLQTHPQEAVLAIERFLQAYR